MFKKLPILVLALLCLNFAALPQQPQANKAIDVTTKGIQIGQKIPLTESLAKYEGKLIILDFWATWCSPCIAMIPKMEVLQEQFKDELQIIPVTYQSKDIVEPFLQKLQKGKTSILPNITSDKELHQLFPHIYLPHYVWIDESGTVKAITGYEEVTAANIQKMIKAPKSTPAPEAQNANADPAAQQSSTLKQKRDMKIAYDKNKPLLINGNGGDGHNLMYHSLLTGFQEGLPAETKAQSITQGFKVTATNISLPVLYTTAFNHNGTVYYGRNRVQFNLNDKESWLFNKEKEDYSTWKLRNTYCYELLVPAVRKAEAAGIFQDQLRLLFPQFTAKIKAVKTNCLVLLRTSEVDKLASNHSETSFSFNAQGCTMERMPLNHFIINMNVVYLQNSPIPLIDGTGYTQPVDLKINANLSDLKAVNAGLARYDLRIAEQSREIDMLVIEDTKTTTP